MDRPRGHKEWVTAGCLGQMTFSADRLGCWWRCWGCRWRQAPFCKRRRTAAPYRQPCRATFDLSLLRARERVRHDVQGADPGGVWRWITSAIDFRMEIKREPDPAGDRVQIVMSGS
jgi:cyanate lyase